MGPGLLGSVRLPLAAKNVSTPNRLSQDSTTKPDTSKHNLSNGPFPSQIPKPKPSQETISRSSTISTSRSQSQSQSQSQSALPRPVRPVQRVRPRASPELDATRTLVTTPKKRAVPLEDVHVRNAPAYSPSKRSRSSKSGTGSSAAEPSTGTATSLAHDLSGVKVAEAPTRPSPAPSALRAPKHPQSKPTTQRIDKISRLPEQERHERLARERQAEEERKIWRHKFRKAFPSFIFYFDKVDSGLVKDVTAVIHQLGGSVDQFFSRNVTHLITTRTTPSTSQSRDDVGKENTQSLAASREASKEAVRKPLRPSIPRSRLSPSKVSADPSRHRGLPLYSERNPFDDSAPQAASAGDIILKAQAFGMKVWRHDKLCTILKMLTDEPVSTTAHAGRQDLSQMLEQEKLYGSHERDPNTARGDYHYFQKGNFYLIVEDATMEHRPIMCSEFEYGRRQQLEGLDPPWPILHGELEGRCPFTKYDLTKQRLTRSNTSHQTLRRAVSLNNMVKRNAGPPSPKLANEEPRLARANQYPLASGNSVSITSNIASTTSTALTEQPAHAVGLPQNRRVAELGKRMHTPLLHSPATKLPASPASMIPGSAGSGVGGISGGAEIGSGSGSSTAPGATAQTPVRQTDHSRGAVVRRMLGMTDHDGKPSAHSQGMRRSVSTSAVRPPRPPEKRPGYCENCRIKYDDFDSHVLSRRHRKFACEDANFLGIDELIFRLQRPLAPASVPSSQEADATSAIETDDHWDVAHSDNRSETSRCEESDSGASTGEQDEEQHDRAEVQLPVRNVNEVFMVEDSEASFDQRRQDTPFYDEFFPSASPQP